MCSMLGGSLVGRLGGKSECQENWHWKVIIENFTFYGKVYILLKYCVGTKWVLINFGISIRQLTQKNINKFLWNLALLRRQSNWALEMHKLCLHSNEKNRVFAAEASSLLRLRNFRSSPPETSFFLPEVFQKPSKIDVLSFKRHLATFDQKRFWPAANYRVYNL
jgi:hypothetical protein